MMVDVMIPAVTLSCCNVLTWLDWMGGGLSHTDGCVCITTVGVDRAVFPSLALSLSPYFPSPLPPALTTCSLIALQARKYGA